MARFSLPMMPPKSIPRRTPTKPKRPARCVEVVATSRLTPNMQRVVLSGAELEGFPPDRDGANFKLIVPRPGETKDAFRDGLNASGTPRLLRTFTIQNYDEARNLLTVDFALHESDHAAPAGDWAKTATPGDVIGVTDGGAKKVTAFHSDKQLLASDMTGLPAMEAILADMPKDAVGNAFFEITSDDDARAMVAPDGITFHWLVHPDPSKASTAQIDAIRNLAPTPDTQFSVVGEHSVVAALKTYFFEERRFDPAANYISPYWKIGLVEEDHQALKRAEA